MRKTIIAVLAATAMGLAACETTGGYGYGSGQPTTQLSQCMRNALIGAGVGAVLGGVTAPEGNRTENAAIGAALGGLGTYGVCRWLGNSNQTSRVEQSYYRALNTNAPVTEQLSGPSGQPATLQVARPTAAPGRPAECRQVNAVVTDSSGSQQLPTEHFCRNATGGWVPVG